MRDPDDFVDSLSIQVGQWLRNKGYKLASCIGMEYLSENDSIGILFGSKFNGRRLFLGVIWFDNRARGANKKNWFFEAYGRNYFDSFRNLTKELHKEFRVSVIFELVKEEPNSEMLISDIDSLLEKNTQTNQF